MTNTLGNNWQDHTEICWSIMQACRALGPKRYCDRTLTDCEKRHVDFPSRGKKGRTIGAKIERFTAIYTALSFAEVEKRNANYGSYHFAIPGVRYGFEPHATRNGLTYGALQRGRLFDTVAEREAAIQKYITDAMTRAKKGGA